MWPRPPRLQLSQQLAAQAQAWVLVRTLARAPARPQVTMLARDRMWERERARARARARVVWARAAWARVRACLPSLRSKLSGLIFVRAAG